MKTSSLLLCVLLATMAVRAGDLRISTSEPLFVSAGPTWRAVMFKSKDEKVPFETARLVPTDSRNSICLVTIIGKDKAEYADGNFLRKLLRQESRPYVASADDLIKVAVKEMKTEEASALYSNIADPRLKEMPSKPGLFKTATPVVMNFGTNYLIKAMILCDDINGPDYQTLMKMVESMKVAKRPELITAATSAVRAEK